MFQNNIDILGAVKLDPIKTCFEEEFGRVSESFDDVLDIFQCCSMRFFKVHTCRKRSVYVKFLINFSNYP